MVANNGHSRRDFLRTGLAGGAIAALAARWAYAAAPGGATAPVGPAIAPGQAPQPATAPAEKPRVSLTHGEDRADIAFQGLKVFSREIADAIGDKRVVIKPNFVGFSALAATSAQNVEGILEFLKSINKLGNVVIAESSASGPAAQGYSQLGYNPLAAKYNVKLLDLDNEGFEVMFAFNETDLRPKAVRMSKVLLDKDTYIISAAKLKTHNAVVATLSLKNIVQGAPLKGNAGGGNPAQANAGRGGGRGGSNDKQIVHGGGPHGINFNLAAFATRLHPHLAVIDGYQGMEGNGPMSGTPVDQHVCVVSPYWLSAERVGLELMGIDPKNVGYLTYCAQNGLGEYDLEKIEVVGEAIKDHAKTYRLERSIEQQLQWMQPPARA